MSKCYPSGWVAQLSELCYKLKRIIRSPAFIHVCAPQWGCLARYLQWMYSDVNETIQAATDSQKFTVTTEK